MSNIKLTIQYDGTNYSGWQKQKNAQTIQEQIEKAINKVTGENVNLIGSGRTDTGVHAKGQVANFITNSSIPGDRFKYALNTKLPDDISIVESMEVPDEFHSRFDALGKEYKYIIYNKKIRNPLYRNFTYHVNYNLDLATMENALDYFLGTHDFSAFMPIKNDVHSAIKTIYDISLYKKNDFIFFSIKGNAFLHNMIRIIVGTLIDVGNKKIQAKSIPFIIKSRDRKIAGHTASAQGLYLEEVYY